MIKFTEEQKNFIYENYKGIGNKELTEIFNNKFDTQLDKQIYYFKRNHHLNSGLTGRFEKGHKTWNKGTKGLTTSNKTSFKKGNIPHNYRPVGSERITKDGYIEIKIEDPNKWQLKHRFVYENIYGDIPAGHNVMFADKNKRNFDKDNLILVSKGEGLIMNNNNLISEDKELTKTGHLLSKVIDKTSKVKKNAK